VVGVAGEAAEESGEAGELGAAVASGCDCEAAGTAVASVFIGKY